MSLMQYALRRADSGSGYGSRCHKHTVTVFGGKGMLCRCVSLLYIEQTNLGSCLNSWLGACLGFSHSEIAV